jgi:DNA polymerase III delta subunit
LTPIAKRSKADVLDFLAKPPVPMPNLVVLFGKEHILADEAIRTIVGATIPDESLRDLNVDVVDAATVENSGEIAGRLAALPFLARHRLVVVRGSIDLKKDDRDIIAGACRDVPEHAVLVIDHSGKPGRPQGRKPKEEAAQFGVGTRNSLVLECALDSESCAKYINDYVSGLGIAIDAEARNALAATEDVSEIKNALDHLALRVARIRVADVREYAVSPQDSKLWDLGDAVNSRDVARALRLARDHVDNPIGPLTWLTADAQVIWELATGSRSDDYARATGQNAWRIGKLIGPARSVKADRARRNVDITMMALERCLTGQREPVQTLEEVIVRLCEAPK